MTMKPKALDVDAVNSASFYARRAIDADAARTLAMLTDAQRNEREAVQQCRLCFYYRDDLAGQAFTAYVCAGCLKEHQHPNTNVPKLCDACAEALFCCRSCTASLDFRARRTLARAKPPKKRKP